MKLTLRKSEQPMIADNRLWSVVPNFSEQDHGTINYDIIEGTGV